MKKRTIARKILLSVILLMAVAFVASHYDAREYSDHDEQEYLNRICEMTGVPAMSVAIMDNNAEIYLNYSRKHDVPIDEQSFYELASTTKAFTALGILQLEKDGKLKLTDPVDQYISWFQPKFKGKSATITIEQLLEHTSGIPEWTICLIPSGTQDNSDLYQVIERIKNIKLNHEPGKVHEYATINYDVLALIIEEVTGQKFEHYMKENVLKPLGMQNSFFRTDNSRSEITQGYKVSFLKARAFETPAYYGNIAAGYLVSNTSELMKWMKEVNHLFDFDEFTATDAKHYYAGWNVYDSYVCHAGNNPNYSSQVIISRNGQLGVFALSALNGSSATEVAENIYQMHCGKSIKIGLYIDNSALIDFVSIVSTLVFIYFMLLMQINSKKKAVCSLFMGSILILGIVLFPLLSHYHYDYLYIWCPSSLLFLLFVIVIVAIIQIGNGIAWFKCSNNST